MLQRTLFSLLFMLSLLSAETLCAQDSLSIDSLWSRANAAYLAEDYPLSQEEYEQILAQQLESADLYYNLANAYFKQGDKAQAILNYHRALRLSPSHEDANYNLKVANALVQDKIEVIPTPFFSRWLTALRTMLSSNAWAICAVVLLVVAIALLFVYLFVGRLALRKVGFYGCALSLLLFVCVLSASVSQYHQAMSEAGAVVLSSSAPVKSSPDQGSKDLFVLHEGTLVEVKSELGEYREIQLSDGNKGWILASAIAMIH